MSDLVLNTLLRMLCSILCRFCDCCKDKEDCPDGVCEGLEQAAADLESSLTPDVAEPGKLMAPKFSFNWDQLRPTIDAITQAVQQIMKFLGLEPKVG